MDMYAKNLSFLKSNYPELYNVVTREKPLFDVALEKVEDQFNFIMENENARCFCHSIYDIEREMDRMTKAANAETKTLIVFGMGCGYAFQTIIRNFKSIKRLVVIEPCLSLFREVMKEVELKEQLAIFPEVIFALNRDEEQTAGILGEMIGQNIKDPFDAVYHLSYRSIFKGYYEQVMDRLAAGIRNLTVNIKTKQYFSRMWAVNTMRNMLHGGIPLEEIIGKFNGLPAVIVSAGPSLNGNIHLLPQVKEKALIFAVGSAIKILDSHGIIPDFRLAVDGGENEQRVFRGINSEAAPLIYNDMLYHEILPRYEGHRIKMITDMDFFNHIICRTENRDFINFRSGFSIANITLDMLCRAGCSKIIFVGQDLCYSGNKYYAEGSWLKNSDLRKDAQRLIETVDSRGNPVLTKASFLSMKNMMEDIMKGYPALRFINASEGGIKIQYTETKSLQEVLDQELSGNLKIDAVRQEIADTLDGYCYYERIEDNLKALSAVEKDTDRILEANRERLDRLKLCEDWIEKKDEVGFLREIPRLQEISRELEANRLYNMVISEILGEVFAAIRMKFAYEGTDRQEGNRMVCRRQAAQALEVDRYFSLIKELLVEIRETYEHERIKVLTFDVVFSHAG